MHKLNVQSDQTHSAVSVPDDDLASLQALQSGGDTADAAQKAAADAALEAIMSKYSGLVLTVLRAHMHGCGTADDLLDLRQETFALFWANKSRFSPTGSVRALLCFIARNTAIDWVRKHVRWRRIITAAASSTLVEAVPDGRLNPETEAIWEEFWRAVEASKSQLSENQRLALECLLDGLLDRVGAAKLGINEKTYSSRVHRAFAIVRQACPGFRQRRHPQSHERGQAARSSHDSLRLREGDTSD